MVTIRHFKMRQVKNRHLPMSHHKKERDEVLNESSCTYTNCYVQGTSYNIQLFVKLENSTSLPIMHQKQSAGSLQCI